jgi:hypothetical protein
MSFCPIDEMGLIGSCGKGYLDDTLTTSSGTALVESARLIVAEEVEVELVVGELELPQDLHAKELVELDYAAKISD